MKRLSLLVSILVLAGCGEDKPTFSMLPDSDTFFQNSSTLSNKLDILFVIDNSGSMAEEQANLAANFNNFISDFATKGYDYRIAVTVSDSWRAPFVGQPSLAKFRDGNGSNHSGVFVIDPTTPNPVSVFNTNVRVGTSGSGDERAFQSFKTALDSNLNAGFRRSDAYLAVIIISDEDDFSHNGSFSINQNYNYAGIHSIASYMTYLDQLTQSTGALRRYSVSAIATITEACRASQSFGIIAQRYMQLVSDTDGILGDICAPDFSEDLDMIQTRIAELSTQFFLSREPRAETIVVQVNGTVVPQDLVNGWTYNSEAVSIVFHGNAIPGQGAQINVDFDPLEVR